MAELEELSAEEAELIRSTVLELSAAVVRSAERVDPAATFSNYSDAPDATHINMGDLHTRESLLEMYRDIYGAARSQKINFGEPIVTVVSRTAAVVATKGGFEVLTRDGKRIRSTAAWTWVWVCRGGSWQVLHSHQSFPSPPSPI